MFDTKDTAAVYKKSAAVFLLQQVSGYVVYPSFKER